MRFVLVAAVKDLRRRFADPAALAVWIGIPLLLGGLMNLVSGSGNPTPRARVLVVDHDDTLLSTFLTASGGVGELVDLETATLEDGRRLIDSGQATALLILPQGFQAAVLDQSDAAVELITNPAERILPGIVEEALEIVVEGVFYAQRLFGPAIRRMAAVTPAGPPSDADVAAISVEINQQIARLQTVLLPPAMQVEVATPSPDARPPLNFGQLFLPGMLFMSFLFIALGMSGDVWEEKVQGTLRRALTTPQSSARLLAGKLLAGLLLMSGVALVALLAAVPMFDVPWTRVPIALAWCAFAGGALIALLTLLQTLAATQRGADLMTNVVVFPLMMVGGSFFPFEAMPEWMASVGRWTPNGQAVTRLRDLLFGGVEPVPLLLAVAAIGIPALAAFALAARRLRGRFATA